MAEINHDIASCILRSLSATCSPSETKAALYNACLVNRDWYQLARPLLYRRIAITHRPHHLFEAMKTQPSACSLLRHLDFSNMGLCPVHCGSTWHELVELLPSCTNLQTISFGALSGYHAARLLCTLARYNSGVKDIAFELLCPSGLMGYQRRWEWSDFNDLQPHLHNWPSVQLLDLDIHLNSSPSPRYQPEVSKLTKLVLAKPRLEHDTLDILTPFISLTELHIYQPHTTMDSREIVESLSYAPKLTSLTLHLAPSPAQECHRALELLPMLYSGPSCCIEMRKAVHQLWITCPTLTRLKLCAAMIDVQDLLATLPSKITCLSVGHFGVSSKDSVMQGLNALYQRRENISLKHFKLHVRHSWDECEVLEVKDAMAARGIHFVWEGRKIVEYERCCGGAV